jgi:excisionase family DNA binding protein
MTAEQAARFLQWSITHTLKALKAGTIPGRKVGGVWRVSKRQLLAYIEGDAASTEERTKQ